MTRVSDEAGKFIHDLLMNRNLTAQVRNRLLNRLQTPSAKETDLRNQIAIVKNTSATNAVRITALDRIIDYFKGDL